MGKTAAQESSGPEGDVMGQDVFPVVRLNHACGHAQRPVEEILSTPWPLYLVGVRSGESHWPHTHFAQISALSECSSKFQFHLLTGKPGIFICHLLYIFRLNTVSDEPEEQRKAPWRPYAD